MSIILSRKLKYKALSLHGRGFICYRIGFDAVTPFVYTAQVEFVIRTLSFRICLQKWSVFKTIRFH